MGITRGAQLQVRKASLKALGKHFLLLQQPDFLLDWEGQVIKDSVLGV